jgi:hypothetical protein
MYAKLTNIRFSPTMSAEVIRGAQDFIPILEGQWDFNGLMC